MSADLLSRAAVKLREHTEKATKGPWVTDGWEIYGGGPGLGGVWLGETLQPDDQDLSEANADFVAMLHPPVALALAELLERAADAYAIANDEPPRNPRDRVVVYGAVRLAREILREPS